MKITIILKQKLLPLLTFMLGVVIALIAYRGFAANLSNIQIENALVETKKEILPIYKLAPEFQIDYFSQVLDSTPAFINPISESRQEYVYLLDDYYVQAITNRNKSVIAFTVTARREEVNPTFAVGTIMNVTLNKTTFDEVSSEPISAGCFRFQGASIPNVYFEAYNFGNIGNYRTYLVGMNGVAWPHEGLPSLINLANEDGTNADKYGEVRCDNIPQEYRKAATPNSYTVWDGRFTDNPLYLFGVDASQMR